MLNNYTSVAAAVIERNSKIEKWPEIKFTEEDRNQLRKIQDVVEVGISSLHIATGGGNVSIIPSQYVLFSVFVKEIALPVKAHLDVIGLCRKSGLSANDIANQISSKQMDFSKIPLDSYSKKIGGSIFWDDKYNLSSKSIVNGKIGNYLLRSGEDIFGSIILKLLKIPAASSDILGHFVYSLTDKPEVYSYLERRFLSSIPSPIISTTSDRGFGESVLRFLYQYDKLNAIKKFIVKNKDPRFYSIEDGEIKLTSCFNVTPRDEPEASSSSGERVRWFNDPLAYSFLEENNYLFISTEWAEGAQGTHRLSPSSLMALINKNYPEFFCKQEEGKYIMGAKSKVQIAAEIPNIYGVYLAAIRTKPFILLAGISGTGKSRLVRQLAKATCPPELMKENERPGNFEMIQVRPNWHDSTELMGYVSRVSGDSKFIMTPFVRFLAEAWYHEGVPFFLCLDEMNLAPVEQYFAEYLSVIETRRILEDGKIGTDILVKFDAEVSKDALDQLYSEDQETDQRSKELRQQFSKEGGIRIPPNLIVMGTVNMDETTFSFSRKVLDRAMSIELNNVDLDSGITKKEDEGISIPAEQVLPNAVEAVDVYNDNMEVCIKALSYLKAVNNHLAKKPFKVAYRTRNEVLVYAVNRIANEGTSLAGALDEITSMKILSRIEGDEQRIDMAWLLELTSIIENNLREIDKAFDASKSVSLAKLSLMEKQLKLGYVSYWT